MKTISEILISAAILACYCYTLIGAHILLSGMDKKIRLPRHSGGIININSVQALVLSAKPGVKKAIMLLRLGNYIVYLYVAVLAGALVFGYPHH
jgi:hypothetical protein